MRLSLFGTDYCPRLGTRYGQRSNGFRSASLLILIACHLLGIFLGLPTAAAQGTAGGKRADGAYKARSLGSVKVIVPRYPCLDEVCMSIEVSCPEVSGVAKAWLKIGRTASKAIRGTVLATTGGPGDRLYEEESDRAHQLLKEMQQAGFQTVQLQWLRGWLYSEPGKREGHKRLACRSATVARWVYDNLHTDKASAAYCTLGNSGGASQVSYMLANYGLDDILSLVIPSGGPPMARLDRSCLVESPEDKALEIRGKATRIIDGGFGFPFDGSGPCSQRDKSFRKELQEASVAFGDGDYFHPKTMVSFLFGAVDDTNATAMGMTYYNRLKDAGSPLVRTDILPNVGHGIKDAPSGAAKILSIVTDECRLRP